MNNVSLNSILDKIIILLSSVEEENWRFTFERFKKISVQIDNREDEKKLKSAIIRIYGGMGSFSDLVLYSKEQVLIEDNQKLDLLRKELFKVIT